MRLRSLLLALALFAAGSSLSAANPFPHPTSSHQVQSIVAISASIQLFDAEQAAQRHCPTDQVVWLNTCSGIYHEKGMRWYGNTKYGAYVCRKEADAAGYRDTRNGQ